MIRDTVSRQLWSALRAWLRKPQMVVTGLNSLSRYVTACSLRASRMLRSLKESAKGSPWSRAKRARTSCKVVMGALKYSGGSSADPGNAAAGPGPDKGRAGSKRLPASLYAARPGNARRQLHQAGQVLLA